MRSFLVLLLAVLWGTLVGCDQPNCELHPDDLAAGVAPVDDDFDGFCAGLFDCRDSDPLIHAGMAEQCNGIDDDCDGVIGDGSDERDDDIDGVLVCEGDCNDKVAAVHPLAAEICDLHDNNCDGVVNEEFDTLPHYRDEDGDNYGLESDERPLCETGAEGWSRVPGDCADKDPERFPGASEVCDGVDNDCDELVDEQLLTLFPMDADGDGWGLAIDGPGSFIAACAVPGFLPEGTATRTGDCDDEDATVHPGQNELCDGIDSDCDGLDHDASVSWFIDADGDGVGAGEALFGCAAPAGSAAVAGDCDDADADVFPGQLETCDGRDEDCDEIVDERGDGVDADGDCVFLEGACASDCDDLDPLTRPGQLELCNGLDDDCNGLIDDGFDSDGDGVLACAGDCDDEDPTRSPAALEVCDGVDNDCDGATDEGSDLDGDRWTSCDGDCDDANSDRHPGHPELCDGFDNDCDGVIPEDEFDGDGDGLRDCGDAPLPPDETDEDGDGVSVEAGDCDDGNPTVFPGAEELCDDGIDQNCDLVDAACPELGDITPGSAQAVVSLLAPTEELRSAEVLGDLNGDGIQDLLLRSFDSTVPAERGWVTFGPISTRALDELSVDLLVEAEPQLLGAFPLDGDLTDDVVIYGSESDVWVVPGPYVDDINPYTAPGVVALSCPTCGGGFAPSACAAELTGDGVVDLVVGGAGASREVYLFEGPLVGPTATPSAIMTPVAPGLMTELGVSCGSDLTGDGVADLVVSDAFASGDAGALMVVPGPLGAGTRLDEFLVVVGEAPGDVLQRVAELDMDGDGVADMVVNAPTSSAVFPGSGRLWVLSGPLTPGTTLADASATFDPSAPGDGTTAHGLGEFNGDGVGDILLRDHETSVLFGPFGGAHDSAEAWALIGGTSPGAVGDLDGDGIDDFGYITSDPPAHEDQRLYLFLSGSP